MKKILVTGSDGQLGQALKKYAPENIDLILASKKDLDFNKNKEINLYIKHLKPDWVINCAAYTAVDLAEKNIATANQINGFALKEISSQIKQYGGKLIHISTDFIFDGEQNVPYKPYREGKPINAYGFSKLSGEKEIEKELSNMHLAVILRTSWLMGNVGKNFISTILRLNSERKEINVVSDQIGSPTSTFTLAKACWKLVEIDNLKCNKNEKLLKLHWSDSGVASWYDVAVAILEISFQLGLISKKTNIKAINSSEYKTLAKRPKFSVLDCHSTVDFLGLEPIHWRTGLYNVLEQIKN